MICSAYSMIRTWTNKTFACQPGLSIWSLLRFRLSMRSSSGGGLEEVVLSRELTIRCGRHEFTWQSLKHSAQVRLDHENNFQWSAGTQEAAKQVIMLYGHRSSPKSTLNHARLSDSESRLIYSRILLLLSSFHAAQCANEQD